MSPTNLPERTNPNSIVVQRAEGQTHQLILVFHGVGDTPAGLVPVAQSLACAFPNSTVVSVAAADACDMGSGYQWFSVRGITEENRPERVAAAMPAFVREVREWQVAEGVGAAQTALIGFSQGAIMSLESTRLPDALSGRVVSIAGRFASPPEKAAAHVTIHLLHGKLDPVIPYRHSVESAHRIMDLGGDVTADVVPHVAHSIDAELLGLVLERLQTHIPKRLWDEAMSAPGATGD